MQKKVSKKLKLHDNKTAYSKKKTGLLEVNNSLEQVVFPSNNATSQHSPERHANDTKRSWNIS